MSEAEPAQALVPSARARRLHHLLLVWYDEVRRDLPWRRTKDPYAVWLSEIMLQQTRVETVVPYFERFVSELPTVQALAEAPSDRVMSLWSGLGYYRRARMLHEAAQQIVEERAGAFPETAAGLVEVRGIGRYTAGAIASIAFGARAALVDGNVARVLARIFAVDGDVKRGAGLERVWALAGELVPEARSGDWNQALMELGATTCIPRAPRCLVCPVRTCCEARAQGIEGDLPRVFAKAKPIVARRVTLVATWKGGVVLARRKSGGLFGGLWEPPTIDETPSDEEARSIFRSLVGASIPSTKVAGVVTHVLSHRRLETRVLIARLTRAPRSSVPGHDTYETVRVVPQEAFARLGMSSFARKVLAVAGLELPAKKGGSPNRKARAGRDRAGVPKGEPLL